VLINQEDEDAATCERALLDFRASPLSVVSGAEKDGAYCQAAAL
jgi:hypothetical protein